MPAPQEFHDSSLYLIFSGKRCNSWKFLTQTPISRNGTQPHGERNCYGLWNIEKRFIAKFAQLPISLETPIGKEEDSHLDNFIEAVKITVF
ncbi:MAG: hypothetical protein AN481_12265 [Aphanizomenon flos-aquae LD13]|jgi:hypothetical protein|uniref:Uncharacterized protein n=1 Tax=Aphanizomenon flos-aquae LD13 TaxID=1710894 RepID=A0A1B7VVK4_APHFL|nr:MAG: hypothetical protein AN481_12265 [Aphanizomenon flos-aquae LD13]